MQGGRASSPDAQRGARWLGCSCDGVCPWDGGGWQRTGIPTAVGWAGKASGTAEAKLELSSVQLGKHGRGGGRWCLGWPPSLVSDGPFVVPSASNRPSRAPASHHCAHTPRLGAPSESCCRRTLGFSSRAVLCIPDLRLTQLVNFRTASGSRLPIVKGR